MRLATRLALVFMIFAVVLLAAVGSLSFNTGRESLRAAAIAELQATALEKEAALSEWVERKQAAIALLATDPGVLQGVDALLTAPADSAEGRAARVQLMAEFRAYIGSEFESLGILHAETGRVMLSTVPEDEGKFREDRPYFINGRHAPFVQDVYYSLFVHEPAMTAAAPLRSESGRLLGVLAGRLDLAEMDAIMRLRTGLRETDDAFLVNSANLPVTQPRFIDDPAVLQLGVRTEAVDRCLEQNSGVIETADYRGVPAIIVHRWLPERGLCLIVKMDEGEALAPVRAFGRAIAVISLLALAAAAGTALALGRGLTRPILSLKEGADRFGDGELDVRLSETSRSELGELARSFNRMADSLAKQDAELRNHAADLERRVAERTRDLQESRDQLQRAEQIGEIGSWEWRIPENRVTWSDGLYHVFGLEPQEFGATYEAYLERVHPDDVERVSGIIARGLETGDPFEFETRIVRRDGQLRSMFSRGGVVENEHGEPVRMNGIAVDITEKKQAEAVLQRAAVELRRSNEELEQFAYVASHDLQEPLRMVSSYVQLLARRYEGKLDQDADEFIGFAVDGATRMQRLINDLLAYSRVSTRGSPFTEAPLEAVLDDALANLQFAIEESGAEITRDPLPVVRGDPGQLALVFQNLLSNAIKFRGDGSPTIHIGARREANEWVFWVSDSGIGIDPRFAERIFIIFQRLNERDAYPGTGIGLAITKRIVLRHGGRIWVDSETGRGATFHFTIPFEEPQ